MVDETVKVWLPDAGRLCSSAGLTWKFADETGEDKSEPPKHHSSRGLRRSFYTA